MSGVYNVFLKWAPADRVQTASWARYLFVFANRYEAEEFYRLIQTVIQPGTNRLMFEGLTRQSAQFWCHSGLYWTAPYDVQALGLANAFQSTLATTLLNDGQAGGRSFDLITNPVTGPDWLSGTTFFIRNRRQPHLYWCAGAHVSYLHTSNNDTGTSSAERRTKFRVEIADPASLKLPAGQSPYFTRPDRVIVTVVGEASAGLAGDNRYLGVQDFGSATSGDGGNASAVSTRLALVATPHIWTFADLVLRSVGVRWEDISVGGGATETKALLVPMSDGGADEWELC